MLDFGFYNMDCMEAMKDYPDNYFDLAIVDPPYGGGLTEGGGCKGWFSKYHQETPENAGGGYVLQPFRRAFRPLQESTDNQRTQGDQTELGVIHNGATSRRQKNYFVGYSPR